MSVETPNEYEATSPRFGVGDPDIVADALAFIIHGQMWPQFPYDEGGTRLDLTPVIIDALTRSIFEHPN